MLDQVQEENRPNKAKKISITPRAYVTGIGIPNLAAMLGLVQVIHSWDPASIVLT